MVLTFATIFWLKGEQNIRAFDKSNRDLQTTTNDISNRLKSLTQDLAALNNKNIVVPRALRRGET